MAPIRAICIASLMYSFPAVAQDAPEGAAEGACYIRYTAPAVIETVTEQILVQPEKTAIDPETGETKVVEPAVYATETVQKIVSDRKEDWAEVICAKDYNDNFVKSLQRALAARGFYRGNISGAMDDRTKRAVRNVQKSYGVNSSEVTLDLAESYGLVIHHLFVK